MSQTKLQSAAETAISTAVGFGITVVFTALSLARGYVLRRVFNRLHARTRL